MDDLLGQRLGAYRLTRLVASGGMAAIYEGRHDLTDQVVAIKVLARDLHNQRDPLARIIQEGRVICSILHEHVIRVFDYGTANEGVGFVVMELLEGETLSQVLYREGPIEPDRLVLIGRQLCDGLGAAHARGVFHRDIKPSNIMLARGQRHRDFVKILDFGIAKLSEDDPAKLAATATGMTLGTPEYMSPEQAQAGVIDARSDLYQVGILFYELLTGTPPFSHRNPVQVMQMHLLQAPRRVRERRPGTPEELEALVMRLLAKRPEERFQSARELEVALNQLAGRRSADSQRTLVALRSGTSEVVGNLSLPALGSLADLERYGDEVAAILARLWPDSQVPQELQVIQAAILELRRDHTDVAGRLRVAREAADSIARELESREQPLERAISTVAEEKAQLEDHLDELHTQERHVKAILDELDGEYAQIYESVERHQAELYASAGIGAVDFRDLYREDIALRLDRLDELFRRRTREAERLNAVRRELAEAQPRMSDIQFQLAELGRSRLSLKAERAGRLGEREFAVADLDYRRRALERGIEHRSLQLGLAFRRAVARLIEARKG